MNNRVGFLSRPGEELLDRRHRDLLFAHLATDLSFVIPSEARDLQFHSTSIGCK